MKGNLFSASIDEISWADLESFCETKQKEDIELDYKSDWPTDLASLICAFANTQGGLILIGINEQNRIPTWPPNGVSGESEALRQKAINIAYDAIYPPVEPEVTSLEIPDDPGKHVVVIRIYPTRLMHSVNRRRRIFVRSNDSKRGYDLADISELRWLWDQRESNENIAQQQLKMAIQHSNSRSIEVAKPELEKNWAENPRLQISLTPIFPRPSQTTLPTNQLNIVGQFSSLVQYPEFQCRIPWQDNVWRTISGGICLRDKGFTQHGLQYVELSSLGLQFFAFSLMTRKANEFPLEDESEDSCVFAVSILASIHASLFFATEYYNLTNFSWPARLSIELIRAEGHRLYHTPYRSNRTMSVNSSISAPCPDNHVTLYGSELRGASIEAQIPDIVNNSARALVWAFGLGWATEEVNLWVAKHQSNRK